MISKSLEQTREGLRLKSTKNRRSRVLTLAGFQGVGIHTLRHSHGSQLLSKGVPLPAVSKRLGHSSVATTARIYAHALPKDDITAAEVWDTSMRAATEAKPSRVS